MDTKGILFLSIAAILGALAFGILFRTPRRYLPHTTAVGFLSCMGLKLAPSGWTTGFSTFVVALLVGSVSHLLARRTSKPAQAFLIPGVIFLVPGTYIYRSFSLALEGEGGAIRLALDAVTISIGISFALLLANWLVPSRREL